MKHSVFLLAFMLITSVNFVKAQSSKYALFHDEKADTLKQNVTKILIVGIGSSATRIFLDKLSVELISKLKKSKINVEYQYMGKQYSDALEKLKTSSDSSFDGYLFFSPKDTSGFYGSVTQGQYTVSDATFYHQNFNISFYTATNKRRSVWNVLLDVNFDINEMKIYMMIVNYIYKSFKKNEYIQ